MRCDRVWRGAGMLVLLVPAVTTLLVSGAGPVSAATLNVCLSGCPYTQIAPAVAAAKDGDTIRVGPGTYRGGITIDSSIQLAGAGAGSTVIRGGAHVLTMGAFGASSEPTVSVSGVTITGGIARSSPESTPFYGEEGVAAGGGGGDDLQQRDRREPRRSGARDSWRSSVPGRAVPGGAGGRGRY